LKAVHHILASSAEIKRGQSPGQTGVNLHRPTSATSPAAACVRVLTAQVEIENPTLKQKSESSVSQFSFKALN
jgi:hypothetical protein